MDLQDRCVLVTGGAHRVGKAIAMHLAKMGAKQVVFTYNSSEVAAKTTILELKEICPEVLSIRCDQSDVSQIRLTMGKIVKEFDRLDVLVNSASVFFTGKFETLTEEDWNTVMNVNARGPFFFMQLAAPIMKKNGGGCIINIIDESVKKPALSWIHHGASKSALWNLTTSGAIALAPDIRVNAILPGAVLKPPDWSDERWEKNMNSIPLKKMGSAEDVCKAVEFIIKSDFVTGQMIVVDGGTTVL
jgi:NAD(P)-dependent dehydrogenase (short-subunit alcohol dehydrogenase family)